MNSEYNIKVKDIILVEITEEYIRHVGKLNNLNHNNKYTILGKVRDISYEGFEYITIDVISTNIPSSKMIYSHESPATVAMSPKSAHYIPSENIKILEND